MKYILQKFGFLTKAGTGKKENPVYDFFVKQSSGEKKKAYVRALEAAQEDQRKVIAKYKTLPSN